MMGFILIASVLGIVGALYVATPLASVRRWRAPVLAAVLAVLALGIYAIGGQPGLAGQPYSATAARLAAADPATLTDEEQEERLRALVRASPGDAAALAMLGRLLAREESSLEAIAVLERSLRIDPDPRVMSDLGQTLVNLNEGEVTAQARQAFLAAHDADPALPEPAFFLGVAAYEAGDRAAAGAYWSGILGRLEPGNPFGRAIAARAADLLSRPAAGPLTDGGEVGDAPFAGLDPADADAMIARMIERVAARIEDDPDDLSGWMTLARAQATRGETSAAQATLSAAVQRFGADRGQAAMLEALGVALQLTTEPDVEEESR